MKATWKQTFPLVMSLVASASTAQQPCERDSFDLLPDCGVTVEGIELRSVTGFGAGYCKSYPFACESGSVGGTPDDPIGPPTEAWSWQCVEAIDTQGDRAETCAWVASWFKGVDAASRPAERWYGVGPRLAVTAPALSATVSGTLRIAGWAHDYGPVRLLFGIDGQALEVSNLTVRLPAPASCIPPLGDWHRPCDANSGFQADLDTTMLADGPYQLQIVAVDSLDFLTGTTVPIFIDNVCADSVAPIVSLTAPAPGSRVSGVVEVKASAADGGELRYVQFLVNGMLQKADLSAPYTWSWNTARVGNGQHTLRARAEDGCGNTASSSGVVVEVRNDEPKVDGDPLATEEPVGDWDSMR